MVEVRAGIKRQVGAVVVLALTSVFVAGCARPVTCDGTVTALHADPGPCLRFGVSTPGGSTAVDEFLTVARTVGKAPSVVLSFSDFATAPPIAGLDAVSAFGADPIVTWEPWRWIEGGTYDSSGFALQSIVDGVHDDYLYRWADELTAWGKPVYLRFAHEPNGTWYPWSVAAGTPADVYVAAWRHVHDLFATRRAHNVKWVWSPNVSFLGSSSTGATYPGDDYVDVVGVDGYNWGTSQPWSHWIAPTDLFVPTMDELRRIAPGKPQLVTEVGSAEAGGSKSEWIRNLVRMIESRRDVAGFVWFDHDKEADWSMASTPESAVALAEALGTRYR